MHAPNVQLLVLRLRFAAVLVGVLLLLLWPLSALAQTPEGDALLSDVGELVTHAKLGRTVLALVLGVKLVIELLRRFGRRLPGAAGLWFGTPLAAAALPLAAGVVGGVVTTLANGGGLVDGLIGGVLVGIGAWLPAPKLPVGPTPAEEGAAAGASVTSLADAAQVFRSKGPPP